MWEARPRGDYVQDERYIARSTWMCGAIVSGFHSTPMDVRCDCLRFPQHTHGCAVRLSPVSTAYPWTCGAIIHDLHNI